MNYWLIKSEPDAFSIDDMEAAGTEPWDGIRNYQARNFMRDDMNVGDLAFFYHSNTKPPGIIGIVEVASRPYPDHTAWDEDAKYYDPKSSEEEPRWIMVDFTFKEKFSELIPLNHLKEESTLEDMLILRKGSRLSITPVDEKHFHHITKMAGAQATARS